MNAKARNGAGKAPKAATYSMAGAAHNGRRDSKDKGKGPGPAAAASSAPPPKKLPAAAAAAPSAAPAAAAGQKNVGRGGGVRMSKGPSSSILLDMKESSNPSGSSGEEEPDQKKQPPTKKTSPAGTKAKPEAEGRVPFRSIEIHESKPDLDLNRSRLNLNQQKHPNSEEDVDEDEASFYHEARGEIETDQKGEQPKKATTATTAKSNVQPTKGQMQVNVKPKATTNTLGKAKSATIIVKPPPAPKPKSKAGQLQSEYDTMSEEEDDGLSGDEDYPETETDPDSSDFERGRGPKSKVIGKGQGLSPSRPPSPTPTSQVPPQTQTPHRLAAVNVKGKPTVGAEPSTTYSQGQAQAHERTNENETESVRHKAFDDDDSQTRFKLENYVKKNPQFLEELVVRHVSPATIQEWVCRAEDEQKQKHGHGHGGEDAAAASMFTEDDGRADAYGGWETDNLAEPSATSSTRDDDEGKGTDNEKPKPKPKGPPPTIQLMFDSDGVIRVMGPDKLAEFKEIHGLDLTELACPMPPATIYTPRQNYYAATDCCDRDRERERCPRPCQQQQSRGPPVSCQTRIPYYRQWDNVNPNANCSGRSRQPSAYCNQQAAEMVQFQAMTLGTGRCVVGGGGGGGRRRSRCPKFFPCGSNP